jgi:hypothetical protein
LVLRSPPLGSAAVFEAAALPCLVIAIDPQRDDRRIAADAIEFAQDGETVLGGFDVMQQADAKDAIHRIGVQADGES